MELKLKITSISEKGLIRADNQDNVFISENKKVFCVADGMGGGEGGAIASLIVCKEIEKCVSDMHEVKETVEKAISIANEAIIQYAEKNRFKQMGTTIAILIFNPANSKEAFICHIGDSRVYRFRKGQVDLLTNDHSIGNELMKMVNNAWIKKIEGRKNPLSHVLTRSIGTADEARSEWSNIDVEIGDVFLLCSDGVHDVIEDDGLVEIFSKEKTLQDISKNLKEKILQGGAPDNFSYIIVKSEEAE